MPSKLAQTFVVLSLCASAAAAQEELRLKADRVLDGRGNVVENRVIVVAEGVIVRIDEQDAASAYDYDLTGWTVLPGLIDTHVHIGWHFDPDGLAR